MTIVSHKTRGSSADRELHCAGAIGWDGPDYNDNSDDARLGTAAHDALSCMAVGDWPDLDALAKKHDVDRDELGASFYGGKKIWDEICAHFPEPYAEYAVEGDTTLGRIDLISIGGYEVSGVPDHLRILDWKLGRSDDEHPNQLKAYALAAVDCNGVPEAEPVLAIEAWLMQGQYLVHEFTRPELESFRERLQSQHAQAGKQFSAGPWCKYCPRRIACEPRDENMRAAVTALSVESPKEVSRETLGALWARSRQVKAAVAEYEKIVRCELEIAPIDLGDGTTLELAETQTPKFPRPSEVLAYLGDSVPVDELVSVTKSSIERAIRATAPRGQGAPRIREALAALEESGALVKTTTKRIKVNKGGSKK